MRQARQTMRKEKTKQLLKRNMALLLRHEAAEQITVKQLCKECGINRSTFYLHYRDLQHLRCSMEQELAQGLEQVLAGRLPHSLHCGAAAQLLEQLCVYLAGNADLCSSLVGCAQEQPAIVRLKNEMRTRALVHWGQLYGQSCGQHEYIFEFIASGCIGMLMLWIEQGMPQKPKHMAAVLDSMISRGVQTLGAASLSCANGMNMV